MQLSKKQLKALLDVVSADESRHICRLLINFTRKTFVATDGHRLLALSAEHGCSLLLVAGNDDDVVAYVRRETLMKAHKIASAKDAITFSPVDYGCRITVDGLVVEERDEGKGLPYSSARQVMVPRSDQANVKDPFIGLNPTYLSHAAAIGKALDAPGCRIQFTEDSLSPLRLDFEGDEMNAAYVIMPMRL